MAEGYEGDDFHPPMEPMVIINSQEEEENFFLKLHLCRKSNLKLNSQISQADQFRSRLSFLRNEVQFKSQTSCNQDSPEISIFPLKKKRKPSFKIKLFKKTKNPDLEPLKAHRKVSNNQAPIRLITQEEALTAEEPYAKRKSSPLEKCPICKKYFRRMKTHMIKHEILQNQGACAALICNFCNKAFNSQSNLQIHMRTHTGDKPYVCEVCNKSFTQSCNLVNHMRIHTGEKPFKCPHCDRAFTQSGNLNNHIRLHTDEKPFKCHFCDKAFVQSGNLSSHIRNNHRLD